VNVSARLAWNSVVAWIASLAGALGGFVLVGYLVRRLGFTDYGIVELLDGLVIFAMLSDLGLRGALGRHLTEHIARSDDRRMNQLLTLSAACYLAIAVILVALCWFLAPPLARGLKITGPELGAAIWLIRLFVPAYTLIMFVGTSFTAVIESHHRFDIVDVWHTVEVLLRLLLIYLAISLGGMGLWGWAGGYLLAKLLSTAAYALFAWRLSPTLAIRPRYFDWSAAGELFSLSGLMLLYQTVFKLNAQADPFVLSSFWGPEAVGLYRPAFRVVTAASPFVAVVNRQLRPLATNYFVQGRHHLLRELLIRGTKISLLLSLPFAVIFICLARPLIDLWLGSPATSVTAWVLILWTLADLASHAAGAQFQILLGMNRIRFVVTVQTIGAILNVLASIALIGLLVVTGWSMNVCVAAIVLPTIVTAWGQRALVTAHVARETGVRIGEYLRHGFLPAGLVGALLLGVGALLPVTLRLDRWETFLLAALAIGVAWLPLTWLLGFDAVDRARALRLLFRQREPRDNDEFPARAIEPEAPETPQRRPPSRRG
jgi:O-antigen/teichoic acid export membrane protein